jgi:methionyl-tRNA formyltransferase
MRLAYFGLPLAACLLLRDGHDIALATLSPVEAPGRRRLRRRLGADRLLDAAALGRELEPAVDAALARTGVDLVVSWFWTRRLPERWLSAGPLGAVGVHPSLLPRHRGPDPFFWAIDCGDELTGACLHRLTPDYDAGDVLLREELPVGDRDAWALARALDRPSLRLLREGVARLSAGGKLPGTPQDERLASWAPEPAGEQLRVRWSWPTERVLRRVRALSPVPGVPIEVAGQKLFVTRATAADSAPTLLQPGEAALLGDPPAALVIRTGDGALQIEQALAVPGEERLDRAGVAARVAERSMLDCGPLGGNG